MLRLLSNSIKLSTLPVWTSMSRQKVHELDRKGARILCASKTDEGFEVGVYPAGSFARHKLGKAWSKISIGDVRQLKAFKAKWRKSGHPKNIHPFNV